MRATLRVGACLVVALAVGACADETSVPGSATTRRGDSLDLVLQEVKRFVEETADVLLPGATRDSARDNGDVVGCITTTDEPSGDVMTQFGYRIELPPGESAGAVLRAARELWESKGFEVDDTAIADDFAPAIFLSTDDGYNYEVAVNELGIVIVGGSTPCVPPTDAT